VFGRGQAPTRQDLVRAEFGQSVDHFRQAATHAAGGIGASVGPRMGASMDMARGTMGSARERMGSARGRMGSTGGYMRPGVMRAQQAASKGWDTTIAVMMPLADAARQGSIRAASMPVAAKAVPIAIKLTPSKKGSAGNGNGHRTSAMVSIVAAGAALGATGALVARRRNRSRWAEYEPSALQSESQAFVEETRTAGRGGDTRPRTASKMAGWAKEHSRSAVGGARDKVQGMTGHAGDSHPDAMADPMTDPMAGPMTDPVADPMADPMTNGRSESMGRRANNDRRER
jgi:hypothetical protein